MVSVRLWRVGLAVCPMSHPRQWHLTEAQVAVAARYIEEHRDEVMVVHRHIEDRKARGNPPDILAKAAKSRAKLQAWLTHQHETKT